MCSVVMTVKAMATATAWALICGQMPGSQLKAGSIRRARAGSPIQPSARLASVMPSCVAAI